MTRKNPTKIVAEPAKQELITRDFDAPRELVFRAFTDPDLYVQWIGPRGLTTRLETFEPRNGGSWRYIQRDKDGNKFAFPGVHHRLHLPRESLTPLSLKGSQKQGMLFSKWRDSRNCPATGQG